MIRMMETRDIETVVSLEKEIFNSSLGQDMMYREITSNDMAHYFVMEYESNIVGYISTWIDDIACQFLNFFIVKEYRLKGLGKELVKFVIDYALDKGVSIFSLEVRKSNEGAIKLYEGFSFKYSHTRKNYYADGEDALVYIRM